jgi:redox-sensitive bicupin YhaK (pirin superfamily)
MFEIINSDNRHFNDFGWLQTYWLFSFGNYYHPANLSHGALRVFNDDIVQPRQGFPKHPHEEMEIISIVLSGTMRHEDTMGNVTDIIPGDVQRMTAGTGLFHSEWNASDRPVYFFQIWIQPDTPGLPPSYDQKTFTPENWQNRLALLASNHPEPGIVALNTEASLYRARLTEKKTLTYTTGKDRHLFLYVIEGKAVINGRMLNARDQARIHAEEQLTIGGAESADLILIDVP